MGGLIRFVGALVLLGTLVLGGMYAFGFWRDVIVGHQDPGYYTENFVKRITGAETPDEIKAAGKKFRTELNREASLNR